MATKKEAAGTNPAADENVRYDVQLNGVFPYEGFNYMPGQHHVVDKTIFDAMTAAGKVSKYVEQLS
jgi:hypothetical protein